MFKYLSLPALAAVAVLGFAHPASAKTDPANLQSMSAQIPSGPDHGMPDGTAGGDGATFSGNPDLQVASSIVAAGGAIGKFSIAQALTAMVGADKANAEVAKLTQQYGKQRVNSYITVQNFAVDDAVKLATAAGVAFPQPTLTGADLAKQAVTLGLLNGTYYEGYFLDHIVTNKIHEQVMSDIDNKYGTVADANYHLISDQAHYDLAQALGATTVQLAQYH